MGIPLDIRIYIADLYVSREYKLLIDKKITGIVYVFNLLK